MHKPLLLLIISLMAAILPAAAVAQFTVDGLTYTPIEGSTNCSVKAADTSISGDLVIPSTVSNKDVDYTVTQIYNEAFKDCTALTSVTIPDNVTTIDGSAFENCSALTSVMIGNGVTSFGFSVFSYCTNLNKVIFTGNIAENVRPAAFNGVSPEVEFYVPVDYVGVYNNRLGSIAAIIGYVNASDYDYLTFTPIESTNNCEVAKVKDTTLPADLVIPSAVLLTDDVYTVTKIRDYAFESCTALTSVTIPDGVQSIGISAFLSCVGMESVAIPNTVTSIGYAAFQDCTKLISLTIPDNVTTIGDNAFRNCTSLTSVMIGDGVTSIGEAAFYGCKKLVSVTIPSSVRTIGSSAFQYCTALASVTIPSSVTSIGRSAFYGCTALASVKIPEGVISIEGYAFYNCTNLTSVTIPESVTSIGNSAFQLCTALASVTIPENVTSIGDRAFNGCKKLASVAIPDNVKTIGEDAFRNCTSLASVTIPEGVTSIGNSAFYGCTSLTSVTIPENVTSIGTKAFNSCSNLNKVVFIGSISGSVSADTFSGIADGAEFYVPVGTEAHYAENLGEGAAILGYVDGDNNSDFLFTELADNQGYEVKRKRNDLSGDLVIPSAVLLTKDGVDYFYPVTKIRDYAFESCTALTSVKIPEGVKSIGASAFRSCDGMESVAIPNTVTSIGVAAFYGCEKLASVTIPESVTTIGQEAFRSCESLSSIEIGGNITSMGSCAFGFCSSLSSVIISDGVTTISQEAFRGAPLTSVVIPSSVTKIDSSAFYNCKNLVEVIFLGDSSKGLESNSFYGIASGAKFYVPAGTEAAYAEKLGKPLDAILGYVDGDNNSDFLFEVLADGQGCSVKKKRDDLSGDLVIPDLVLLTKDGIADVYSVTSIEEFAFYGCTNLESVTIPASVTLIGKNAFQCCESLGSVTIPKGVTSIGNSVFQGCTGLGSVTIPEGVTSIGESAFEGCSSLKSVTIPERVTSIGHYAFFDCTSLVSVTIPESITSIGRYAFHGCKGLASIIIPARVTSIETCAFYGCTSLASVIIPASAEIGSMAFEGCGTQAQDPVQVVMLSETPISNITDIGLPMGATVYVANAEAVSDYTEKLGDAVKAIEPILAVTDEPEKEYYKASEEMEAPAVVMASVYKPETVWSAELLDGGMANGAVKDGMLVVIGHGDVTFRVSDVNNPQVYATYSIKGYLQGDANYDGRVTVTDAANVASHIVGSDVTGYFELGADANEDNSVNIADVTTIVDIALDTDYAGGIQPGGNSRARGAVEAWLRQGAVDVALDGIACGELTAVQADVVLAPGARIRGVARGDCLSEGHSIAWREHDGGRVRVIVYSLASAALRDGSCLFTIEVDGEAGVTTVDNIFASTTGGEERVLGYGGHVTGIAVPVADDEPGTLYDLGGRVVARGVRISEIPSETPRGVYIFRNSKGATKLMHE